MLIRRVWPSGSSIRAGYPDPARLRRDMDRLFDMLWTEPSEASSPGVFPAMNVTQDGDKYYVRAELPGVNPGELSISVERNKLSVAGKRELHSEGEGVSYHRRERAGGSFSRSITLPEELNADAVEATYANGILTIALPKAEAAKAREIKVKAG